MSLNETSLPTDVSVLRPRFPHLMPDEVQQEEAVWVLVKRRNNEHFDNTAKVFLQREQSLIPAQRNYRLRTVVSLLLEAVVFIAAALPAVAFVAAVVVYLWSRLLA